jgi:hypothetical protein
MERDTIAQEIHGLFHRLWSKAVGTPDYDKSEWKRFDILLQQNLQPSAASLHSTKA